MTNYKVKKYLLPWLIALVFCGCVLAVLSLFMNADKLCLVTLPIIAGGFLSAVGYNVYELIVSLKNK